MRRFTKIYINGKFVTPHGTQIVDLINPSNNAVIGKINLADAVDARDAIAAAKQALKTFSRTTKEQRMDCLQRLHDALSKRVDELARATTLEYGAPA